MKSFSASTYPKCGDRKVSDIFRQKKKLETSGEPKHCQSSLPHIYPSMDSSFLDMRKEDADNKSEADISFSDVIDDNAKILASAPNCSIDVPNVSIISSAVPCRNLMDQFETMDISSLEKEGEFKSPEDGLKNGQKEKSPTSVDAYLDSSPESSYVFPLFKGLRLSLSQSTVNRVSFYGVIHNINKEISSMATNDTKQQQKPNEEKSALIVAVNSQALGSFSFADESVSSAGTVLIDEEHWMLSAINLRGTDKFEPKACPPGFAAAIGEEDLTSSKNADRPWEADTKTQLWKPSRSWWEARSGKNPWIEPNSHNKRWRYLWPLIHYHKFITKCIKKLKRNSVDVSSSTSPVCVFLREEVCAISEHLGAASKFSAEEWVEALKYFDGWTEPNPEAESRLRAQVGKLKLRSDCDDVDLCSPLLRNQIDESFLNAMATAKEQMINGVVLQQKMKSTMEEESNTENNIQPTKTKADQANKLTAINNPSGQSTFHQNSNQQHESSNSSLNHNSKSPKQSRKNNKLRRGNNRKVKNAVSSWTTNNTFNNAGYQPYGQNNTMYPQYTSYPYYIGNYSYGHPPPQYNAQSCPDWEFPQNNHYPYNFNAYSHMHHHPPYDTIHNGVIPSYGLPPVPQSHPIQESQHSNSPNSRNKSAPNIPPTPNKDVIDQSPQPDMKTPYKQTPASTNQLQSPVWGHLDHGTLAMAGLVTPGGLASPHHNPVITTTNDRSIEHVEAGTIPNAQLWINPLAGYYYHQQVEIPPSPATQFMMGTCSNNIPFHNSAAQGKTEACETCCESKESGQIMNTPQKQEK